MLDHSRRPRQTAWGFNSRGGPTGSAFVLRSLPGIRLAQGARVHDSYGRKCNSRFLLSYGFTLRPNADLLVAGGARPDAGSVRTGAERAGGVGGWSDGGGDAGSGTGAASSGNADGDVSADAGGSLPLPVLQPVPSLEGPDDNTLRLLCRLEPLSDPWYSSKLSLLAGAPGGPTRVLRLSLAHDAVGSCEALSWARLSSARGEDCARLPTALGRGAWEEAARAAAPLVPPLSLENEAAALGALAAAARDALARYPTALAQDAAQLEEMAAEGRAPCARGDALRLLAGEKAIAEHYAALPAALAGLLPGAHAGAPACAEEALAELQRRGQAAAEAGGGRGREEWSPIDGRNPRARLTLSVGACEGLSVGSLEGLCVGEKV